LKSWVAEVLEQAAIASTLAKSSSPVLKRLSLIIVDNAFEFMLKAFVEFDSQIIGTRVTFHEWKSEYKGNFEKLTHLVLLEKPNSFEKGSIMRYHNTRNNLYHEAQPLTVDGTVCNTYVRDLTSAIERLFGETLDPRALERLEESTRKTMFAETSKAATQVVEVDLDPDCSDRAAICAVVHEFHQRFGKGPKLAEIDYSLSLSGHAVERSRISVRLSELRGGGFVARGETILRPKGRGLAHDALRNP